jgi:hypothetical protein
MYFNLNGRRITIVTNPDQPIEETIEDICEDCGEVIAADGTCGCDPDEEDDEEEEEEE